MDEISWSAGTWTTPPAAHVIGAAGLVATAVEGSDAWRHTSYGFVHDSAHGLLAPLAVGEAVEVVVATRFSGQFDQAGILVRRDAEHWVKAGLEFADGVVNLGAVVTAGHSDWSVAPVQSWNGEAVRIRVSRAADSVTIRAGLEGDDLRLVRVAPFAEGTAAAGPYLCAPTRSGFTATFTSWRRGAADGSLH